MKNIIKSTAIMIALIVSAQFTVKAAPAQQVVTVSYDTFYDALTPYGTWIDYPGYGHVWHPDVADFRPYATNGYWEYTDGDWYWDSGYDWGWAPFHYGDWFYDDAYGWLWEPGYEWSPAWVDWGIEGDYYAWAPVGPRGWDRHDHEWNMVDRKHFYDHDLNARLVGSDRMRTEAGRIKYEHMGPNSKDVERYSGHKVVSKSIRDVNNAGMATGHRVKNARNMDNHVNAYRPKVNREENYGGQQMKYRQATRESIRPVQKGASWPTATYEQHTHTIQRMPVETGRFHDGGRSKGSRGRY